MGLANRGDNLWGCSMRGASGVRERCVQCCEEREMAVKGDREDVERLENRTMSSECGNESMEEVTLGCESLSFWEGQHKSEASKPTQSILGAPGSVLAGVSPILKDR